MAAIPYVNNIPLATDKPRDSQPDLNTNTQGVKQFVEVDHRAFANSEAGKHDKVTLPRRAALAPAASELIVFSNAGVSSGNTELYFTRDSSATTFNMTERSGAQDRAGWTYLPSGMKMIWGRTNITTPTTAILFSTAQPTFPGFTNVPNGQISSEGVHRGIFISNINATQIVIGTDVAVNVYWTVIGI